MFLEWLNDLIRWFAQLFPRWALCRCTHRGMKFLPGGRTRRIDPGIYLWWPATTEVQVIPVVRYSVSVPAQGLTTRDGKTVDFSIVMSVEISDVELALAKNWDVEDTIAEVGGAVAVQTVVSRDWGRLLSDIREDAVTHELTERARDLLHDYGVHVRQARVTDCTQCTVVRTVGAAGVTPITVQQEPGE